MKGYFGLIYAIFEFLNSPGTGDTAALAVEEEGELREREKVVLVMIDRLLRAEILSARVIILFPTPRPKNYFTEKN